MSTWHYCLSSSNAMGVSSTRSVRSISTMTGASQAGRKAGRLRRREKPWTSFVPIWAICGTTLPDGNPCGSPISRLGCASSVRARTLAR